MNTFVALGITCGVALIRGRRALKAGLLWMGLTLSAALFAFDSELLLLSDGQPETESGGYRAGTAVSSVSSSDPDERNRQ